MRRGAVEREFARLKVEWALLPLRVRAAERVQLHADLTILAKLSCALARARTVPIAAENDANTTNGWPSSRTPFALVPRLVRA